MTTVVGEDDAFQISIQKALQLFGQSLKHLLCTVFRRHYEKQMSLRTSGIEQTVIRMLKES